MEEYQISQGNRLRCGYTTGRCATAASKAAAMMLLTGKRVDFVQIKNKLARIFEFCFAKKAIVEILL